jgi:hypothetical protein
MTPDRLPPIDRTAIAARLDAFFASVTAWLCACAVWMAEMAAACGLPAHGWRAAARAEVIAARRDVERALIFAAALQLPMTAGRDGPRPPGNPLRGAPLRAPDGFGRTRGRPGPGFRRAFVRQFRRGVGLPRLRARLDRLRDLVHRRDLWIARLVRWLASPPHGASLRVIAPAATPLCVGAMQAVCAADTS